MYQVARDEDPLDALVNYLYDKIIQQSSEVLKNAEDFSIEVLKKENPSYAEIAEDMKKIGDMMDYLINHGQLKSKGYTQNHWTLNKAQDYVRFVAEVAKAIQAEDEIKLKTLTKTANEWSFL
ncbi:hypothetical protein ACTL6P_21515 [Endozoicomonas acroporae]|uniref:hypothetical protein n=1 Tax=Endozoicomonas acroporae TaxID=1701104 RepID=UPI000C768FA5|nr:hypothetical protein [Endozoicomonas acroporae]